jgi:hypothetical protein
VIDLIGHCCNLLKSIGLFKIARKAPVGWVFRICGGCGWIYVGIHVGLTSIWIWGAVTVATDVIGLVSWRDRHAK